MKIKLLHDWMGNKAGATLDIVDRVADDLITRGAADKKKGVGRPQKDKMMHQSINK